MTKEITTKLSSARSDGIKVFVYPEQAVRIRTGETGEMLCNRFIKLKGGSNMETIN